MACVAGPPSAVASGLASGALDAGLVPSVELLRQPDLTVVSDACIAARGPVWSVVLLLRRPPEAVDRLVLDRDSRTSQVLARLVLRDLYGQEPRIEEADPVEAWARGDGDAVLMIGDPALRHAGDAERILDLSEAWLSLCGLPFVFAVWAGRRPVVSQRPGLAAMLEHARTRGLARLDGIAAAAAGTAGVPVERARVYLKERIRYRLAAPERAGLERFWELARPLVVGGRTLPCSTSGSSGTIRRR